MYEKGNKGYINILNPRCFKTQFSQIWGLLGHRLEDTEIDAIEKGEKSKGIEWIGIDVENENRSPNTDEEVGNTYNQPSFFSKLKQTVWPTGRYLIWCAKVLML